MQYLFLLVGAGLFMRCVRLRMELKLTKRRLRRYEPIDVGSRPGPMFQLMEG
jgi:hypothetical protein